MGRTDRRKEQQTHQDGSSKLDVGLDATQAPAAFGRPTDDAAVTWDPSWYVLGNLDGGEIGENTGEEEVFNEAGELVSINTGEETFDVGNTLLSTDLRTIQVMKYLASGDTFPMRYPLPAGVNADGQVLHQLWCFHNARVVNEDRSMPTNKGETRTFPFTVRAYKKGGKPLYVAYTVVMDDPATWPDELADFQDDRFSPTA